MAGDSTNPFTALPDEILIYILGLIPSTKLRARTSLISRRWRDLWTAVPALDFPSDDFPDPSTLPTVVDHSLSRSAAATLLRFRAGEYETPSPASFADLDRWFRSAASRRIADLALSFVFDEDQIPVDLPPSLYACARSLTSLRLAFCGIPPPGIDFRGFPSLTSLHLYHIRFSSDESLAGLLSACPLIETLNLTRCRGVTRIEVSSAQNPHLKYLNLERVTRTRVKTVAIDAPSLELLDFDSNIKKLQLGDVRNLRSAQVMSRFFQLPENYDDWMQIVSAIAHVELLAVTCWFFEFVLGEGGKCPPLFSNLRELHWLGISITRKNIRGLISCLCQCPNLEKLIIDLDYNLELEKTIHELNDVDLGDNELQDGDAAEEPVDMDLDYDKEDQLISWDYVIDVLPRLRVFTITQFSEDSCSMQVLEFVLRKAKNLEQLHLTMVPDEVELESLRKEILGFYRASPHVQIKVSEISGAKEQADHKIFQHLWRF